MDKSFKCSLQKISWLSPSHFYRISPSFSSGSCFQVYHFLFLFQHHLLKKRNGLPILPEEAAVSLNAEMNWLFRPHLSALYKTSRSSTAHRMRTIVGADLIAGARERRGAPDERMRADGSWPAQDRTAAARRRLGAKMKHIKGTFLKKRPMISCHAFAKARTLCVYTSSLRQVQRANAWKAPAR